MPPDPDEHPVASSPARLDYAKPDTPRAPLDADLPETWSDFWRALSIVLAILTALLAVLALICGGGLG